MSPPAVKEDPEVAIRGSQLGLLDRALENTELVAKSEDLKLESGTGSKPGRERSDGRRDQGGGGKKQVVKSLQVPSSQFVPDLREAQEGRPCHPGKGALRPPHAPEVE